MEDNVIELGYNQIWSHLIGIKYLWMLCMKTRTMEMSEDTDVKQSRKYFFQDEM